LPAANLSGGPQEIAGSRFDEHLAEQAARITASVPGVEGGPAQVLDDSASMATLEEMIDTTAGSAFSFLAFGVFAPRRAPGAPSGQGLSGLPLFSAPAGPSSDDDLARGQGVAEMFVKSVAKASSGPGVDHAPAGSALRLAQAPRLLANTSPAQGETWPPRTVVRGVREAAGRERAAAAARSTADQPHKGQVQLALNEADGRVNVLIGARDFPPPTRSVFAPGPPTLSGPPARPWANSKSMVAASPAASRTPREDPMALAPISGSSASQSAYGLDFQSLLKIILTQLTYQDPLKPLDNFQFVSQLAQFSQLQQSQTLNDQVTNLLAAQATTQATGMLGKTVDVNSSGTTLSGVVQSISFVTGAPELTIKTADGQIIANLAISNVSQIR